MRLIARVLTLLTVLAVAFNTTALAANGLKKFGRAKVTDAAGRTHARPAPRITDAQKKAAAQRRKANALRGKPANSNSGKHGR